MLMLDMASTATMSENKHLMKEVPESSEKFDTAMKKISTNSKALFKSSVKTLLSTLQSLQKKPSDSKNRKLRMENIVIKKYISGVQGAQEFLEAVGFRVTETGSKKFLEIEQDAIDQSVIARAIDLLNEKLKDTDVAEKGTKSSPQQQKYCAGGCGFFGDEKTENMCSLCYKKKHGHAPPVETKSGPPVLCTKGCGFFGLTKFKGMCSVCYNKESTLKRKDLKRRWRIAMTKIRAIRRFKLNLRPVQKNKTRCWKCQRKVGITGIECRCGYIFCGKDRYPSEHDCPYDFKLAHKKKLEKENLKVVGKKFEKIDSDGE